jgi:RimK family alpha-L-glutamate ligase
MALLIAGRLTPPNVALLEAARELGIQARLLPPDLAERRARTGETILGRVDVRDDLTGVEPGLESLAGLERLGFDVLNRAQALLAAHDKLETAARLQRAGVPHPQTTHVPADARAPRFEAPVVLKPRFGSWGTDVVRCDTPRELRRAFAQLSRRPWFRRHGLLVQKLLAPAEADLRVLVASGIVVGAISRRAASGDWRTNIALGGTRTRVSPSFEASRLAVAAAAAVGADFVGVDLLPVGRDYVVIEVNGCVDFTADYSLPGGDVFDAVIEPLLFPHIARVGRHVRGPADKTPALP